jgi:hypothetical protein
MASGINGRTLKSEFRDKLDNAICIMVAPTLIHRLYHMVHNFGLRVSPRLLRSSSIELDL